MNKKLSAYILLLMILCLPVELYADPPKNRKPPAPGGILDASPEELCKFLMEKTPDGKSIVDLVAINDDWNRLKDHWMRQGLMDGRELGVYGHKFPLGDRTISIYGEKQGAGVGVRMHELGHLMQHRFEDMFGKPRLSNVEEEIRNLEGQLRNPRRRALLSPEEIRSQLAYLQLNHAKRVQIRLEEMGFGINRMLEGPCSEKSGECSAKRLAKVAMVAAAVCPFFLDDMHEAAPDSLFFATVGFVDTLPPVQAYIEQVSDTEWLFNETWAYATGGREEPPAKVVGNIGYGGVIIPVHRKERDETTIGPARSFYQDGPWRWISYVYQYLQDCR